MGDERLELLSEQQRNYLRCVHRGLTSKEIAQQHGGSHHTVNAEIALAMRLLGARSRAQAANMLIEAEMRSSYERSYEPPAIAETSELPVVPMPGKAPFVPTFSLPIPTAGRPTNELSFWQRTRWIVILAVTLALAAGGLLSGIIAQLNALGQRI